MFDLLEECQKAISLRSDPEIGTRPLVEHLAPLCREVGLNITLQLSESPENLNLIAHTVPPDSPDLCPQGILLNTHLDTVPGGNPSLWTETGNDPFHPTIKGDQLFGRGSADTKLDFLCKLKGLENIQKSFSKPLTEIFKIPVALVGTYGEETALAGARLLRQSSIMHPKFALVGEPCELKPVIAHKGIITLHAWCSLTTSPKISQVQEKTFRGKAAHGATPHLGENAIYKGIGWLFEELKREPNLEVLEIDGGIVHNIVPEECRIKVGVGSAPSLRIQFLRKFFEVHQKSQDYIAAHINPDFDPAATTTNVGVIRSDGEKIEIIFDYRLLPQTDPNHLVELFQELSRAIPQAKVDNIRLHSPMATSADSELAQYVRNALEKIELPTKFLTKSGATEGSIYSDMGIQSVIFGPGLATGNIHSSNEFMYISHLNKAVEFYEAFLRQFC